VTTVYILKQFVNPDCNASLTFGVYEDYNDAIKERDRLRALTSARAVSLEYGVYSPRLLIDVVAYEVKSKEVCEGANK